MEEMKRFYGADKTKMLIEGQIGLGGRKESHAEQGQGSPMFLKQKELKKNREPLRKT